MPPGRVKGQKDVTPRKRRTDHPHGNPAYASHGNIKNMVEKSEKKEDISRIVGESFQYFGRPRPKNNEELRERLNDYFQHCIDTGQIPTVEDMALSLGVTRATLWEWENKRKDFERAEIMRLAKEVLAGIDAKLVSEGKIPQVTYIFRAKNYFGMKDQTTVSWEQGGDRVEDRIDEEQLRKKYLERGYEAPLRIEAAEVRQLPASSDVVEAVEVKK